MVSASVPSHLHQGLQLTHLLEKLPKSLGKRTLGKKTYLL